MGKLHHTRENYKYLAKGDLYLLLYERLGWNQEQCVDFVNEFFEIIMSELELHGTVNLTGFGTFFVEEVYPHDGEKNLLFLPTRWEVYRNTPRLKIRFKPAGRLREFIYSPKGAGKRSVD